MRSLVLALLFGEEEAEREDSGDLQAEEHRRGAIHTGVERTLADFSCQSNVISRLSGGALRAMKRLVSVTPCRVTPTEQIKFK